MAAQQAGSSPGQAEGLSVLSLHVLPISARGHVNNLEAGEFGESRS